MLSGKNGITAFFVVAAVLASAGAHAQCVAARDMNGVWRSNDGGIYYVRQIGNDVWWLGMSADNGRTFTNVYKGVRNGDIVTGYWADVPKGATRSGGVMNLRLSGGTSVAGFETIRMTGGFGGSRWYQPCGDVNLSPSN